MVMETTTYDPHEFPPFAVTVDVVVLTLEDGALHVLLVRRGVPPFEGMWAIPGGFKRTDESLDEAAQRELLEETGVDGARLLRQFGAYGDPGRDPRMNVVTVAYLAVLREVEGVAGGTDAAAAELVPVSKVASGELALAFDHLGLHRVVARLDARNDPSARLAARLGMRQEAHFVSNEMFKGEWSDEIVYAMLAEEWPTSPAGAQA